MNTRNTLGLVGGLAALFALAVGVALNFSLQTDWSNTRQVVFQAPQNDFNVNNLLAVPQVEPCSPEEAIQLRGVGLHAGTNELSGPYAHGNLAVYLIHGPNRLPGDGPITLQEALAAHEAVVGDTGVVLTVDNLSKRQLFIQAGDIVKGGNQDRVLPYDQIIPPETKAVTLAAYCVEAGRSGPRGDEVSSSFEMASDFLPTTALKRAAMQRLSQNDIWGEVASLQEKLSKQLGESVQAPLSLTSLQLTLEHPLVRRAALGYVAGLDTAAEGKGATIGCVVAINGQVRVGDIYASHALFSRFWPKLLKAAAVEAAAEGGQQAAPTLEAVQRFLKEAEAGGTAAKQNIGGQTLVLRQESGQAIVFDACLPGTQNVVMHRTYLAK